MMKACTDDGNSLERSSKFIVASKNIDESLNKKIENVPDVKHIRTAPSGAHE